MGTDIQKNLDTPSDSQIKCELSINGEPKEIIVERAMLHFFKEGQIIIIDSKKHKIDVINYETYQVVNTLFNKTSTVDRLRLILVCSNL